MRTNLYNQLLPLVTRAFFSFAMIVVLLPVSSQAQWNTNTSVNLLISNLPTADMQSASTTDGKTWIAFYHENAGNYDMRAQLIDANGYKLLGTNGMLVSNQTSGSATYVFNVCVDGLNNLIIGFQDQRTGTMQSVLYKISQTGTQLWGANGIVLGGGLAPYPAALSNGEVAVVWNGDAGNTLNLQKITTSGTLAWGTPIQIKVGSSTTTRGQIIANTAGKFTMVYQMGSMYTTLYAQMFDNTGTALYSPLQICNQTTAGYRYYSILAESDTTYYGYYSSVGFRFNSFLQRINPGGTIPWGMNGSNFNTSVASNDNYQMETSINMTPGSNYIWSVCTFSDYNQTFYGIYMQKFLKTSGARQFTDAGKAVFAVGGNNCRQVGNLAIVSDNPMFMFYDNTNKIFATRLDASGNFAWTGNIVELSSTTSATKGRFCFTPDGPDKCAGVWTENRGSADMGYAQGVSIGGLIGLIVTTQGSVPATITVPFGTLQMLATIYPATANQNVTWSIIPGTGAATITAGGLVSALSDGTVYAKAVSIQDNTMKDSLMITISGQVPLAPSVTTLAATNINGTGATLNATVTAHNSNTSVTFNWGLTAAYGNIVTASPSTVTGNSATPVFAGISGLAQGTTYHFRCVGVNSIGTTYGTDLSFTTCLTPGTPGTITGPPVVCQNQSGAVYSISPVSNATSYNWTLPGGASITAGGGTTSITVSFSSVSTSGNVTVAGANSCTSGSVSTKAVTVNTAPAPAITGSNSTCVSSFNYSYTTEAGMNNYNWTITSGGSITSGAGTNSIQVLWNIAGAQNISVNYSNSNGCQAQNPATLNVTVNDKPAAAGSITGPSSVCAGAQGLAYSITAVVGASSYQWALPSGAGIASGSGTENITVNYAYNAASGSVNVTPQNSCGNGAASNLSVTVASAPATPTITANGYLLTSSAPSGNQWYLNGNLLGGATSQTYTVQATGWYHTVVTQGGCSSDSSNTIYILWVGVPENSDRSIEISPVPNNGHFNISISSPTEISYTLSIYNNLGVKIYGDKNISVNGTNAIPVDLGKVPAGLYTVVLQNNDTRLMRKVLIDK